MERYCVNHVNLSFDAFKSIFEVAPDEWVTKCPDEISFPYHLANESAPGCYVTFEKKKDYHQAMVLIANHYDLKKKNKKLKKLLKILILLKN